MLYNKYINTVKETGTNGTWQEYDAIDWEHYSMERWTGTLWSRFTEQCSR